MTRITVELEVVEAFQVVAALAYYEGHFSGMCRDMRAKRIEQGNAKPSEGEASLAVSIGLLQRASRRIDEALYRRDAAQPDYTSGQEFVREVHELIESRADS